MWTEDDCVPTRGFTRHSMNQLDVVLAGDIGNVDRSTGDTTSCSMERRPFMRGLKHVPIREDVQMLCHKGIMCIAKDMPRMRCWHFGEEIIRVAEQDARFVRRQERVEHDLRNLGHARNSFGGEISKLIDVPCVLICVDEISPIISVVQFIEEELAVRFNRVDPCRAEKAVEVFIKASNILLSYYHHLPT